ncbi:MAG: HAD family hydrolase [Clostridia bacterium]|nr:HAD family hydrolase [Clostridia bacterium]
MSIKVVLFDLDGTLLPLDQNVFVKKYFGLLAKKLGPYGYEANALVDAIWLGIRAMVKNDGAKRNDEVFWDKFGEIFTDKVYEDKKHLDDFYQNDFKEVKSVCSFNPEAPKTVRLLKERGIRVALATNPIFPTVATEHRIRWAGLEPNDFEFYTTYENSYHCKPNPDYYRDLLNILGVAADECVMVGNDVTEDMISESLGMKVFLLTDCIINKENKDISIYPNGDFSKLIEFIDKN